MLFAYTRAVSPALPHCELTTLDRQPIDVERAIAEHEAYESMLRRLEVRVRRLPATPKLPDGVFVEDAAVVFDELAVITRPGAESRRPEIASVARMLAALRPLACIEAPATLDGGDVLVLGHRVFVGLSSRTNQAAVEQLAALLHPIGYVVIPVTFTGCLHLKSAVTPINDHLLLLNPEWVEPSVFRDVRAVEVDASEPHAANALAINGVVLHPSQYPRTRAMLEAEGISVAAIDIAELGKAESGVTCCSLILRVGRRR
jgi:dimethylargininase